MNHVLLTTTTGHLEELIYVVQCCPQNVTCTTESQLWQLYIFWHIKKSVLTDSPDNLLKVGSVHLCSH